MNVKGLAALPYCCFAIFLIAVLGMPSTASAGKDASETLTLELGNVNLQIEVAKGWSETQRFAQTGHIITIQSSELQPGNTAALEILATGVPPEKDEHERLARIKKDRITKYSEEHQDVKVIKEDKLDIAGVPAVSITLDMKVKVDGVEVLVRNREFIFCFKSLTYLVTFVADQDSFAKQSEVVEKMVKSITVTPK